MRARMPLLLPTLNAILNSIAAVLLVTGFVFIKQKKVAQHRACMLAALGVSAAFLVSYLIHHARVGSVPFKGPAALRPVYYAILIPHVLLAVTVVPLALVTVSRGFKGVRQGARQGNLAKHKALARVTLPIWLFVSVSGVVVYLMLYQM
jgi:putative membrane protein